MDRFSWSNGLLEINETLVIQQRGVRLYDGDDKAKLDVGVALLSTHRLIWRDVKNHECCIAMPLSQIIFFEEQAAGIGKSAKIVIHLYPVPANKEPGPYQHSKYPYIKLSFKEHGQIEFYRRLTEEMTQKRWESTSLSQPIPTGTSPQTGKTHAVGIIGIERKIEQKRKETDKNISEAFEDLSKLMVKAKEMVELSRSIANKIKDKQGDITEDETIRFKSYLLSMGIADPVTRETHGSGTHYHLQLAKQLGDMLQAPLEERGGMMALTEVYCLVNRARGMEVSDKGSLTAEEFAKLLGLSVLLSKERNASVFVNFITKSNISTVRNTSLSLVNTQTNTTLLTRTLPNNQSSGRLEFDCSCFLYAGAFRFLLRQTSTTARSHPNVTDVGCAESTAWWWSSELQVGISTNEHFQACSSGLDSALLLEVSYMEYNQIGRNSIDKVRARTRHPIKPLRSQSVELPCAFPFTERDFIQVALRSPHTAQEVKSSGPLYLSRIFSYKLLVENANAYKSGCEGTMTVKLITPPCAHINGKVLLYKDAGVGKGVAVSSGIGAAGTALMGFGPEEPSSPPVAFNWLTQGENETEFNCSVFDPGRSKYCFRFVFNFSRSPSPAQTCLVVHRSSEHGAAEWTKSGPQRNEQRKPWIETTVPSHNSELKHTGTNTNSISASEKDATGGVSGTGERRRSGGPVGGAKEGLSGIGGPAAGPASPHGVNQLSIERAELNWNRRGPSPIQRNILARKLKEAQSCSGVRGRQRSFTFSASSSEPRTGRCHSLQMSGDYSNGSGGSPYRLSEAEQRMLDLDLSSSFVGEEE
ncbi:hypothetical protein F2P81_008875 [Scophthalmus maximus]|uniref:Vacuolar protein-sorting-associated protein 36 n=1 Tax=Scophthalmus maximus TaxID=52904 RepID=A0A6A4T5I6_SCOMX|nr:hypothetical protein F2P81_008875 [Scophthalmus maximus]